MDPAWERRNPKAAGVRGSAGEIARRQLELTRGQNDLFRCRILRRGRRPALAAPLCLRGQLGAAVAAERHQPLYPEELELGGRAHREVVYPAEVERRRVKVDGEAPRRALAELGDVGHRLRVVEVLRSQPDGLRVAPLLEAL